jgi:hypothetical protein
MTNAERQKRHRAKMKKERRSSSVTCNQLRNTPLRNGVTSVTAKRAEADKNITTTVSVERKGLSGGEYVGSPSFQNTLGKTAAMIRDPSDGTVRELPKSGPPLAAPQNNAERVRSSNAAHGGPDTGIRQPTKTDAMKRLDKSREWLRDYHAKKDGEHARGSNGEEHSESGDSINGQGQAEP